MKIRLTHRGCPGCEQPVRVTADGTLKDHRTPLGHDCLGEKWCQPVGPGPVTGRIELTLETDADEMLFVVDALEAVAVGHKLGTRDLDLLIRLRAALNDATGLVRD